MQKRLEDLIDKIEKAEAGVRDGYRINITLLDQESIAITKALKAKPDATLKPLLQKAVMAMERLTASLEDRVADLKGKKRH